MTEELKEMVSEIMKTLPSNIKYLLVKDTTPFWQMQRINISQIYVFQKDLVGHLRK